MDKDLILNVLIYIPMLKSKFKIHDFHLYVGFYKETYSHGPVEGAIWHQNERSIKRISHVVPLV